MSSTSAMMAMRIDAMTTSRIGSLRGRRSWVPSRRLACIMFELNFRLVLASPHRSPTFGSGGRHSMRPDSLPATLLQSLREQGDVAVTATPRVLLNPLDRVKIG